MNGCDAREMVKREPAAAAAAATRPRSLLDAQDDALVVFARARW